MKKTGQDHCGAEVLDLAPSGWRCYGHCSTHPYHSEPFRCVSLVVPAPCPFASRWTPLGGCPAWRPRRRRRLSPGIGGCFSVQWLDFKQPNIEIWLVVWNMNFNFPIQLGMSCSQLTLTPSFFRGVGRYQPPAKQFEFFFAKNRDFSIKSQGDG